MRQASSFSLHRITAAFIDSPPTFTVFMSAFPRPSFRGGRSRGSRSFSNRPPIISGDSHFQSVHDSNSSFQRSSDVRTINNYNNNNSQNLNSPSNSGSSFNGGVYSSRGRSPTFNQRHNQPPGVRVQRPKPADYRTWEFAKLPPPSHCERFVVLSYNILADYLANSHRRLYFHIPRRFMSWDWRKGNILFELRLWSPDIICFQEVDKFHDLEEDLRVRGYSGIWKMRTGDPIDGCAIFWRTTRFRLMYEECIEFTKHGMRDNVAQICVLESLVPNQKGNQLASSTSSKGPNRVVICNIHVLYNPRRGEIKLGQVRILLERAQAVSKTWDDAPVVLCGDFNCTPMSPLYNFISEQKLDISEVDRDKVSGQASAEIRPPPRQYGPQLEKNDGRIESANYLKESQDMIKDEITSAKSAEINEPVKVPENSISSSLSPKEKMEEVPISEDSSWISNSDRLSSVTNDFDGNNVEMENSDNYNSSMSCSDNSLRTSPESIEVKMLGSISEPNPAGIYEASDPETSSALNHDIDGKMIGLSLNEIDEPSENEEYIGEDDEESLSDVNNDGDAFPPNLGDLVPDDETVGVDKPYDPSLWTPTEIATATGNANSTVLEHHLKLRSTYSEIVDSTGTRDLNGEPLVTSYNSCFMGTVDYIWRSEGLCTTKVLAPISKEAMQRSGGFPTKKWGSDHIALASELAFTKK